MGKFRSKLKGQSKGKRWAKGQSSSSNPETRKHRDLAKSRFFSENLGATSLTLDALNKHNALQTFTRAPDTEMEEDVSSIGTYSSYKTIQSFASEWSECSNMSYNRFLNVFTPHSALHKEMLAILAAITEVIKENGGSESPTEYFCSLLTTMDQVYNSEERNEDQITACLALLNMGIKKVPEGVLRANFNDVSTKILKLLNDYAESENNTIIKSIFGMLSVMLRCQDSAVWSQAITVQIFETILNPFCTHTKPKWRKAAQHAAAAIVNASDLCKAGLNNVAADQVAVYCEEILDNCMGGGSGTVLVSSVQAGQTTILHILGLMKETIRQFSKTHMKKCCEALLRLMTLNYPIVTSCALQVLHALFSSEESVVSAKLNGQLITALYEYQPAPTDVQPTLAWIAVMQQAHRHLGRTDLSLTCTVLPKMFTTLVSLWLSGKVEVTNATTHAIVDLLSDVREACCKEDLVEQHRSKLEKCFHCIQSGLGYQYNSVWHQVLHVIGVMFTAGGQSFSEIFAETLKFLAELRDSYKFNYNNEVDHAVGAAIRSLGPEKVLNIITLKKENGDLNIDRSWLLPVLKENIKNSTLECFINNILPLAMACKRKSTEQAKLNDGIGSHSSELLYIQLWNLLPSFCNHPTDISENLRKLAKTMGDIIREKKELRLAVMAALRKLIASVKESQNEDDLTWMVRFDKNYLPILFNFYTAEPLDAEEEGQRLATFETIKMYLTISHAELNKALFTEDLQRLQSPSEELDSFTKESLMDLVRLLIPYQDSEGIELLYQLLITELPETKNTKDQKKLYRLLEEICSSPSEACKDFVKDTNKKLLRMLTKLLEHTASSSKAPRLRCFYFILKAKPELDHESKLIRTVLPEAVMCCKDINTKCRSVAYEVINTVGEILSSHGQIQEFVTMVIAGLAGSPQLMSCTVLALAAILHKFSNVLGQENIKFILDNVCTLTACATREVVASCLSFIKVYCTSFPKSSPMVLAAIPQIVKALTEMTEDCQRHFRLKTRDILDRLIRKYGCESISPHVPAGDTVMHKRLRNMRKLNARKKKQAQNEKDSDEDEEFTVKAKPKTVEEILADSDSDFEEMQTDEPVPNKKRKKQAGTWIEEDEETIVDFTDPGVISKITATRPKPPASVPEEEKKKEKDRGFKRSTDGRLIIEDDSSDNEGSKKNKFGFDSDDEDSDDNQSKAETAVLADKKRKRSDASVKSGFSSTSQPAMKYKTGGIGIHRPTNVAKTQSHTGSEFKSKKAAGDVKTRGKVDPYAYLPLQRTSLNKRKKQKAAGQFRNIIKAAQAGALKGAKAKKNKK